MPPEPRPLPPVTLDGLRPPRAGFPYFSGADRFPFQPDATDYSAVNAWWLADASLLVYGDATFVEDAVRRSPLLSQGFRLGWLGTPDDNRGLVLSSEKALVIVFRGTRLQVHTIFDTAEVVLIDQDDLWTDSQFVPATSPLGGRVHTGFRKAFAKISDHFSRVVRAARPGQMVWLSGHSLGGALATLAAAHLGQDAVQGLYTYGCPRVGDAEFAGKLPARSHYRFVHRDDWVPTVPPEFLGYVHAGTRCAVSGGPSRDFRGEFAATTSDLATALANIARELKPGVAKLPFKISGLVDHAPIYYATLLWNTLIVESSPTE